MTRTHVLVVMHQLEAHKTSNTGILAERALENGTVFSRPPGAPVDAPLPIPPAARPVLLFPDESARPITGLATDPALADTPLYLVVPDGTWGQAARMCRRMTALAALPRVALPTGEASRYRLRHAHRPERLATLEAIARALEILEEDRGPMVRATLDAVLALFVERVLVARGKLPRTGGLARPEADASHFQSRDTRG